MNELSSDFVILVDKNNKEKGTMEKMEAHRKGELHRALSVFICNSAGEWLLQRRALNKYHSNGLWTNACCSHPLPGELTLNAARRRLMEEMGMKANLTELFSFTYHAVLDNGMIEHEFDHVFWGITDDIPLINTDEVKESRYIGFSQLMDEVEQHPDKFTIWFKEIYKRVHLNISLLKSES